MATKRVLVTGGRGRHAAIRGPHMHLNCEVISTLADYNVLEGCGPLGIRKVVRGSNALHGIRFFEARYLPVDGAHPQLPRAGEAAAAMFVRRDGPQLSSYGVGDLLCSEDNDVEHHQR
jgi:hypothetical protein